MQSQSALLVTAVASLVMVALCKERANSQFTASGPSDFKLAVRTEINGATLDGTVNIKDGKIRQDYNRPDGAFSLIQTETGGQITLVSLDHARKVWKRVQPPSQTPTAISDEDREKLRSCFPLRFTGKTQEVAGWKCEEFLIIDSTSFLGEGKFRSTAWIAKDFPEGASLQETLTSSSQGEQVKMLQALLGRDFRLPGFALKSEIQTEDSKITMTFTAIKQEDLPDSLFEIPSDYLQSLSK